MRRAIWDLSPLVLFTLWLFGVLPLIYLNGSPTSLLSAGVEVGDLKGRGFVVHARRDKRYVVTAAHCVPREQYPDPHLANGITELTFPRFLGPLDAKERTIWCTLEVLSVMDDVAAFSSPDSQELAKEADQYEQFTTMAFPVSALSTKVGPRRRRDVVGSKGWVFSLERKWLECSIRYDGRFLSLGDVEIEGGMSGSPILNAEQSAIGLVSTGYEGFGNNTHPSLLDCLPQWICKELDSRIVC